MNKLSVYGFLTGLYFSLMQFSFFLMLQTNISSTYVTYMVVVMSWMFGSVSGLWLSRFRTEVYVLSAIAGFYLTIALIQHDPLSMLTLAVAAISVWIAGLWAGRFFVVMLPSFGRTDSMFFHENNGFMIGVIAVFVGFTLIGQRFLLAAPAVAGLITLAWWRLLHKPADSSVVEPR